MTLTLRHSDQPLAVQINRLRLGFAALRHSEAWTSRVTGGAVTLEVKLSDSGQWHPHLHVLYAASGAYWKQKELSDLWRKITGDSWIVDIRDVGNDVREAVGYICSYISKPTKAGQIFDCPERLLELMTALKSRRMVDLLGDWRGWVKEDENAYIDPDDWRRVTSIDDLWAAATRQELWALAILHSIARRFLRSPTQEEASLFSG